MKLLVVEWEDAFGGVRQGWRALKDMTDGPVKSLSVGWVLRETLDCITLVPHLSGTDEGDGEINIPAQWILSKREIG